VNWGEKKSWMIGNRTRDLPARTTVFQAYLVFYISRKLGVCSPCELVIIRTSTLKIQVPSFSHSSVAVTKTTQYHNSKSTIMGMLVCCVINNRPPLWFSGRSFWIQARGPGFVSRLYHWEVVGLERNPFSPVNTIEELFGRKRRGFGIEKREYGLRDPSR
jgi:hypothetical protein